MQMELPGILVRDSGSTNTEGRPGFSSLEITGILAEDVDIIWGRVKGFAAEALDYSIGETDLFHMYTALISSNAQLWIAYDETGPQGVCITEVYKHATGLKECRARVVAGVAVDLWAERMIATVESWALAQDCHVLTGLGRPGWERFMKPFGFFKSSVMVAKVLTRMN